MSENCAAFYLTRLWASTVIRWERDPGAVPAPAEHQRLRRFKLDRHSLWVRECGSDPGRGCCSPCAWITARIKRKRMRPQGPGPSLHQLENRRNTRYRMPKMGRQIPPRGSGTRDCKHAGHKQSTGLFKSGMQKGPKLKKSPEPGPAVIRQNVLALTISESWYMRVLKRTDPDPATPS